MTDNRTDTEDRSDIEQAVDARRDALERGEGGPEPDAQMGEGGADGVVKNQDRDLGQ
ncbi:hypothetical protein [uncultured Sphingomonas sp.]|uniref:hypothetical protein n=1 Tax=uncultured Sphingomonas sp. TaxID=158754 RepID=UPI0025D4CFA2|nr:hypothetical protein [uncultured Sphingomonas sp.]